MTSSTPVAAVEASRRPLALNRRALNPILLDQPVYEADAGRASLFYTPSAQALDQRMPLIGACTAGFALLAAYFSRLAGAPAALVDLLTLVSFSIAGLPALSSVWSSLRELRVDIDVLMLLGAGLAAWIGSAMEGALLLVLFAASGAMETYALNRSQSALVGLGKLSPRHAFVLTSDGPKPVALKEVGLGQHILIRPGDRVPLDGRVVEGASAVDESVITGEPLPREKTVADDVFAGTANRDGRLVVEVTKLAGATVLARVVELVAQARERKAKSERLIDRIGPTYTIGVILFSMLVVPVSHYWIGFAWAEAIRRGIAILIVGSPCALIIATPVAYLSSIAAAARQGILVKGGVHLETLAHAKVTLFDKTGTLTTGQIRLAAIEPIGDLTPDQCLRLAASVEILSTHPLAESVTSAGKDRGMDIAQADDFRSVPGQSISASVEGRKVWIGKPGLALEKLEGAMRTRCESQLQAVRRAGQTAAVLMVDSRPAVLAFSDTLRSGASSCVADLRRQGMTRIEMLTGDHELTAAMIAQQVGLDGFRADLLPEQKLDALHDFRQEHGGVVMVGDGVNDAPALVAADVGIAIGSIGADVALDAADAVLLGDRIEQVAWLHRQAIKTSAIVRQNLTLALGVIVILGFATLSMGIPLPLAVIGHEGSTVLVALNALRLLRQ